MAVRIGWWRPGGGSSALTASAAPVPVTSEGLTAAAVAVQAGRENVGPRKETWQDEVWAFYESLGEFRYAVDWRANAMSRIRLRAGKMRAGRDEPEIVDTGPAADLIAELGGGVGGQAALLSALTVLLDVPGEGWLVGESIDGYNRWQVRSQDEIRSSRASRIGGRRSTVEIINDEESALSGQVKWRSLASEYLTVRIWRSNARLSYLADSRARTALSTMRELDLINRKITAQYLSRLASAGLVVFPSEIEFPVREEFRDEADGFVKEWIETAREAIATPGTAAAVVPIPIRVPGEFVDKVKFVDFTTLADEKEIEKRDSAIKRLATQVDIPAEVLLGMGGVNHWSAWQLDESAIKVHIDPTAELIVHALTIGYLHPRLQAIGEDPANWLVWYDASELTIKPDRSANAVLAYDRFELTGIALRRELGFDEDDALKDNELETVILKALARNPQMAVIALEALTGEAIDVSGTGGPMIAAAPVGQPKADGPPDTQGDQPTDAAARAQLRRALLRLVPRNVNVTHATRDQNLTEHVIDIDVGTWHLRHPPTCETHRCPYTLAAYAHEGFSPGTPGTYRCSLDAQNVFIVGRRFTAAS